MIKNKDALGVQIKRLRKQRGITGSELASLMGCTQPYISKIETGKVRPTEDFVDSFIEAMRLPSKDAHYLKELTLAYLVTFNRWAVDQSLAGEMQEKIASYEDQASEIRMFGPNMVAGLLQTEDYARAVATHAFELTGEKLVDKEIERFVKSRDKRKQILKNDSKVIRIVQGEGAFRSWLLPGALMKRQIIQARTLIETYNIDFGILPLDSHIQTLPYEGFAIYDSHRVDIESMTVNLNLYEKPEVLIYTNLFNKLMDNSLMGEDALDLLSRLSKDIDVA